MGRGTWYGVRPNAASQGEGLKRLSWIMCDNLVSVPKWALTDFLGTLPAGKIKRLDRALRSALDLL